MEKSNEKNEFNTGPGLSLFSPWVRPISLSGLPTSESPPSLSNLKISSALLKSGGSNSTDSVDSLVSALGISSDISSVSNRPPVEKHAHFQLEDEAAAVNRIIKSLEKRVEKLEEEIAASKVSTGTATAAPSVDNNKINKDPLLTPAEIKGFSLKKNPIIDYTDFRRVNIKYIIEKGDIILASKFIRWKLLRPSDMKFEDLLSAFENIEAFKGIFDIVFFDKLIKKGGATAMVAAATILASFINDYVMAKKKGNTSRFALYSKFTDAKYFVQLMDAMNFKNIDPFYYKTLRAELLS